VDRLRTHRPGSQGPSVSVERAGVEEDAQRGERQEEPDTEDCGRNAAALGLSSDRGRGTAVLGQDLLRQSLRINGRGVAGSVCGTRLLGGKLKLNAGKLLL